MKTFDEMEYHPTAEKLVQILMEKTQNTNPLFFRVMVAYYFSVVASMMRCSIETLDRGEIPVNMYAINLSTSGSGKGLSTNLMEEQIIDQFRFNFQDRTWPLAAEANLPVLAQQRAARNNTDPDIELQNARYEFENQGPLTIFFDSGTTPAIKQARHKLLMARAGSLNFQMDEIGTNLLGNLEPLSTFLELYDIGRIKQKLVMNTNDRSRNEEIPGRTPTNMMLFGTPSRLLNNGKQEEEFFSMLDSGYARRCFFGLVKSHDRNLDMTPEELLARKMNDDTDQFIEALSNRMGDLADPLYMNKRLMIGEPETLLLMEYQLKCERQAAELGEHEEMRKAEMSHRYFKSLKLAGAYAFMDGSPSVTEEHLYQAIKLAESSGEAFQRLLTRDRPYIKLAKYIAECRRPVTQVDLTEDLPFFKGSNLQKNDLLQMAITYGYQNNIIIKRSTEDGIEFFRGESLEATDIQKMIISYSDDLAYNYRPDTQPFTELHNMTQVPDIHWANHAFLDGHRTEENAIPGFNMIVLDIDGGINLSTAQMLLKDYRAMFYTTKSSTDTDQRFRILLPMNYTLKLDAKEYKEFMQNVFKWLPFDVDDCTGQRSRKWMSHDGEYVYQEGELVDVLPFIPKTTRNEDFKQTFNDLNSLNNLERWMVTNTGDGNRNNMLHRYARVLVDAGFQYDDIFSRVTDLNHKLPDSLDEAEILSTVMTTVTKELAEKAA